MVTLAWRKVGSVYTLRWQFRVVASREPYGYTLEACNDLLGRGIWTFEQDGRWVNITYDWQVHADKRVLRALSFLLKPIFAANHRWAMRKGEESLRLELARRHAPTPAERARIPPPPGPTTMSLLPLLLGAGAIVAAGVGLVCLVVR